MLRIIFDLVAEILADVGALYRASEAVGFFLSATETFDILSQVALVDMLWSFTHTSISE